jgi:hypothetical protein
VSRRYAENNFKKSSSVKLSRADCADSKLSTPRRSFESLSMRIL